MNSRLQIKSFFFNIKFWPFGNFCLANFFYEKIGYLCQIHLSIFSCPYLFGITILLLQLLVSSLQFYTVSTKLTSKLSVVEFFLSKLASLPRSFSCCLEHLFLLFSCCLEHLFLPISGSLGKSLLSQEGKKLFRKTKNGYIEIFRDLEWRFSLPNPWNILCLSYFQSESIWNVSINL